MTLSHNLLEKAATAQRVVVLTGAGVSAESGVPTFRDAQTGLWAKYSPEELATPRAFKRNPRLVWEWYEWRRNLVRQAKPNTAQMTLAEMEGFFPEFHLITQNVDGLHQQAGSRNVVELHGNIMRTKCYREKKIVTEWADTGDVPPKCPKCSGPLRPDVVWFEEAMPELEIMHAMQTSRNCDLFLSIGTSSVVYPAASLPTKALQNGATVVEINPEETPFSKDASFVLRGPAGTILPEFFKAIQSMRSGST